MRFFYNIDWFLIFAITLIYRLIIFWLTLILFGLRMIPSNDIELIKIFFQLNKNLFFLILEPLNYWFLKLLDFLFFQTLFFFFITKILSFIILYVSSSWIAPSFFCFSKKLIFIILNFFHKITLIFFFVLRLKNNGQLDWQLNLVQLIFRLQFCWLFLRWWLL